MKRISSIIFIALSLFTSATAFAEDIYKFDPNHTYVLWHAGHFGFSNQSGRSLPFSERTKKLVRFLSLFG